MAPKKAPQQKKVDAVSAATRTICTIPGGSAQFYARHELSPRRQRELQVLFAMAAPVLTQLAEAKTVKVRGKVVAQDDTFKGVPIGLSEENTRLVFRLNEVAAWAYLASWTLPDELPATSDDLLDLDPGVYDALVTHAAKLVVDQPADQFSVDSITEDEDGETDFSTPTGA